MHRLVPRTALSSHGAKYQLLLLIIRFLDSAHQSFLCCQNMAMFLGRVEPLALQLGRSEIPP